MNIKQHIITKSADLFKNYGIKSNTMDDIAQASGISKKTLYQHYENKSQLIEKVLEYQYTIFNQRIVLASQDYSDPLDELIKFNIIILELLKSINPASTNDLKKSYPSLFLQTKNRFLVLITDVIIKNIQKGKDLDLYREDINNKIITQLHTNQIEQYFESNSLWNNNQNIPEVFKEIIAYYLHGLVSPKGQELLNSHLNAFNKYLSK